MATLSRRLVAGALSGALLMSAVFFTNAAPCAFAEQEKQPRVLADEPFPQIPVGAPLTGRQYSPHRSYLRPGCTWDVFGRGLQQCNVYSHAMKRTIPVEIMPAKTPGNPRIVMTLDGYGTNNKNNGFIFGGDLHGHLANYDVTLVAPISGDYAAGTYYTDYASPLDNGKTIRWETFLVQELPHYLSQYFRVPVRPHSTALVGLSMGSVGIMNLAQRFPERYSAVDSMSGFYTLSAPAQASSLAMGSALMGYRPRAMWGAWPSSQWKAHDPALNIRRYTMPVRVSCGSGKTLTGVEPSPFAVTAEVASHSNTVVFKKLVEHSSNRSHFTFRIAEKGAHNWAFWFDDLYRRGGYVFLLRHLGLIR